MKLRSLTFYFLVSFGLSAQEIVPSRILSPHQAFFSESAQQGEFNLAYGYSQSGHVLGFSFRQSLASPLYLALDFSGGYDQGTYQKPLPFTSQLFFSQQVAALGYSFKDDGKEAWHKDLRLSFSNSFLFNLTEPVDLQHHDSHDLATAEIKLSFFAQQNKSSGFVAGASLGLMRVYRSYHYEGIQNEFFYEPNYIDGARGDEMAVIIEPSIGYFAALATNLRWNVQLHGAIGVHEYNQVKTNAVMVSTGLQVSWLKD